MLRSFLLSIKMIIIILLNIIFSMSIKIINMFLCYFSSFTIKDFKYSSFTSFTCFFSIKLVDTIIFHKIINLFKLSTFNKSRYKNKFSILNLTRYKSLRILIKVMVIIEVLLYLNKSINISNTKRFIILNLLNKRKIFIKLTSTSNTTNPFFKSNIRLSIIYSSTTISFHKSSSLFYCKMCIIY